ncbi:hypothetical protein BaRGS_00035191 [Batillaria attramentaria]|uniref:Arrestin C-terminal-like domain-containing protein n=1 Tax=Batillaria attramentaria TaxID=370345 RepID=A0ABD0JF75_9CAEN
MPVQGQNQKMICCLCCASGPIVAEFRLERRGYVPGEAISLFADIRNNSNRRMDRSYIDLRMITMFHATSKSRTVTKEIGRMTERPIEEGKSFSWEGQQFVLPPLPPSYLVGCRIIDVRYVLQLNVDPSGPAVDLEVPLEIIIGTIPLRRVVEQFPPRAPPAMSPPQAGYSMGPGYPMGTMHPSPEGATAPPMEPAMPYAPPTNIPNLPPPSYSESVFGKVNVKDEDDSDHMHGNLDYAPVYPYYDWGHQPTIMGDGKH